MGGTYSVKADRNIDITVPEAKSQAMVDALGAGPVGWAIEYPGGQGPCGSAGPLWVSTAVLGCAPSQPELTSAAASQLSTQAVANLHLILQSSNPACPFGKGPDSWAAGLLSESRQDATWKANLYDASSLPISGGIECFAGGMSLSAVDASGMETPAFLANGEGWREISGPAQISGGQAYFTADQITPATGEAYPVTRFAWRSGDLLIFGRLVRGSVPQAYSWLKQNIPGMIQGIKAP